MQAIILAGGAGTHLRTLDADITKPMLPLFDRPIIEHTIQLLARHGIRDILVAASRNSAELAQHLRDGARFGVKLRYSVESDPRGSAGAVRLAGQAMHETFVVASGDVVTDCNFTAAITLHKASDALVTIAVVDSDDPTEYGMIARNASGRITRIVEKPKSSEAFSNEVSAGIYILEPAALSSIPHFGRCDFAVDVFPRLINNGDHVHAFPISGYWRDVATLGQCKAAHFDALAGKIELDICATKIASGLWIAERVEIDSAAEIIPPVYLGAGASVRGGAVVGPNAVIGCETLVDESARVSRSVIGGGCLIGREARVEDSLVGSGCSAADGEEIKRATVFEYARYDQSTRTSAKAPPIEVRTSEVEDSVNV